MAKSNTGSWWLALGVGAAVMYFGDPAHGRRRRALATDQLRHAGRLLRQGSEAAARDLDHRARGLRARIAGALHAETAVPDGLLAQRVRAALGRAVSHSHAIRVDCEQARVVLSGPILAAEEGALLTCVRAVPGVFSLENRLQVYQSAEHISALQGGRAQGGARPEWMQRRWSPGTRALGALAATGALAAAARQGGVLGAGLGLAGCALLARTMTNRELRSLLGMNDDPESGIVVQKSIRIHASPERVYGFWSHYENFPYVMSRVEEVRPLSPNLSRWVVRGPGGLPVQWTSELIRAEPGRLLEWRCVQDSTVMHSGVVRFEAEGPEATRVHVRLCYVPPAGLIGHWLARIFGADPKSELDADLMRAKNMIETGRTAHDAARRLDERRSVAAGGAAAALPSTAEP